MAASNEEYKAAGGTSCPVCGSSQLSGDRYQALKVEAIMQRVSCNVCGAAWSAIYMLVEYTELERED